MDEYVTINGIAYAVDTDEEIKAAQAVLIEQAILHAHVWRGDPNCPDSYMTGQVLFARPRF